MTDLKRHPASLHEALPGPSWPSAATVNVSDVPANPWSKQHRNLTRQGQIYRQDKPKMRMRKRPATLTLLSARFKDARLTAEEVTTRSIASCRGGSGRSGNQAWSPSRQDIADYLGLTIETVSRTLSIWKTRQRSRCQAAPDPAA